MPEDEATRRAAVRVGNMTRLREEPRRIWGPNACPARACLGRYFDVLRVQPVLGRSFTASEMQTGGGAIVRLVLRQALAPAVTGICLGLIAAAALTRLLHSMVFDVSTLDLGVFVAVPTALVVVSTLAAASSPSRGPGRSRRRASHGVGA